MENKEKTTKEKMDDLIEKFTKDTFKLYPKVEAITICAVKENLGKKNTNKIQGLFIRNKKK